MNHRRKYFHRCHLPPKKILEFGAIKDILEKFLEEQEQELQLEQQKQFPNIPTDLVAQILDNFVTEEGTKRVIPFTRVDDKIKLHSNAPDYLRQVDREVLIVCLKELDVRRILRTSEQVCELAHDTLANLIDKKRSDEQRQLNEIKNRIKNGYAEYQRSNVFFTERQLLSMEEFLPKINLGPQLEGFLQDCYAEVETPEGNRGERERQQKLERGSATSGAGAPAQGKSRKQ